MPRNRPPYPAEFRRQLVELVRAGRTPEELSREYEPTAQSISNWVKQADLDGGKRQDGLTSEEQEDLRRLRRDVRTLREEKEILKRAAAWVAQETGIRKRHRRPGSEWIRRNDDALVIVDPSEWERAQTTRKMRSHPKLRVPGGRIVGNRERGRKGCCVSVVPGTRLDRSTAASWVQLGYASRSGWSCSQCAPPRPSRPVMIASPPLDRPLTGQARRGPCRTGCRRAPH
jgi:transposase